MSIRDLFSKKVVESTDLKSKFDEVESTENLLEVIKTKNRFVPDVDYLTASNFAFFGSAKEYYTTALYNIAYSFPYDGSRKEVQEFKNQSSYLDLFLLENVYPRYNGYAILSSNGWGTRVGTKVGYYGIGKPSQLEYITLKGGLNTAYSGEQTSIVEYFDRSNKYDQDPYTNEGLNPTDRIGTRENNLKTNFNNGVTVEFWAKHAAFDPNLTETEFIFDLWNGELSSSSNYGRLTLGLLYGTSNNIAIEIMSGSVGAQTAIGNSLLLADVTDNQWHHYAVVLQNISSNLNAKVYYDGTLKDDISLSSTLGEITGNLSANLGSLRTNLSGTTYDSSIVGDMQGWGKLSGSLDEFRFWKVAKTQEEIVNNYWIQVGGGTNTDVSNLELGVYYKFNEGITTNNDTDSIVLDYSGRITNGEWINYPGSSARSTGSAMVDSGKATYEFKDPTVYTQHPSFVQVLERFESSGSVHDASNQSALINTFPGWITEEAESLGNTNLNNLVQVIASYFDTAFLEIQSINKIKNINYGSSYTNNGEITYKKETPFNDILLDSFGLDTRELFQNQELIEFVANRNYDIQLEKDLTELKNIIYRNIYNNLNYILKSKGTEKSVKNLLRSIGISDKILKINSYTNNNIYLLDNRFELTSKKKKLVNFYNPDNYSATIFQSASSNPNARGINYVSSSSDIRQLKGYTGEINVFFPRLIIDNNYIRYDRQFLTSSVFGTHLVTSSNPTSLDWVPQASDYNLELYAVTPSADSESAYFLLKNRAGTFSITSSLYPSVYTNSNWTFGVKVYNNKYPYARTDSKWPGWSPASGGLDIDNIIELVGYNVEGATLINSFSITASLPMASITDDYATRNFRYYIGANRQNFTGSAECNSDIKVSSFRHYETVLDNETILAHAKDIEVYGTEDILKNRNLFYDNDSVGSVDRDFSELSYTPNVLTNNINLDFELVTGSDSSGKFFVVDYSSGSVSNTFLNPSINNLIQTQYEFTGYGFGASQTDNVVETAILNTSDLISPEKLNDSEMINILSQDDELFVRDNPIFNLSIALEKSYYDIISKEIVNFFGGVVSYNELIGNATDKYQTEYSRLRLLRNYYFSKVQGLKDINAFYSFYRWIDDSIVHFAKQLIPETVKIDNQVRDLIESHILERNKIKTASYPFLEYKGNTRFLEPIIDGTIKSVGSSRINWKFTTPPLLGSNIDTDQTKNVAWWQTLSEKDTSYNTSGNAQVDKNRKTIGDIVNQNVLKSTIRLKDNNGNLYRRVLGKESDIRRLPDFIVENELQDDLKSGVNSKYTKRLDTLRVYLSRFTKSQTALIRFDKVQESEIQDDLEIRRNIKRKFELAAQTNIDGVAGTSSDFQFGNNIETLTHLTVVSSSHSGGYTNGSGFTDHINNIHLDTVTNDLAVPMQSPFTREHVGGLQYRHQGLNNNPSALRAEGFILEISSSSVRLKTPQSLIGATISVDYNKPFAPYIRDEFAKRPLNIKNIKYTTSSSLAGNYQKESDFLLLSGRSINNRAFVKAEGFSTSSVASAIISGAYDTAKAIRSIASGTVYDNKTTGVSQNVIVSRFSAPGGPETSGDSMGGIGLDYESAELSPYNNINYRNLTVRNLLNRTFLPNHTNYGGFASDANNTGSSVYNPSTVSYSTYLGSSSLGGEAGGTPNYHKTFRNGTRIPQQSGSSTPTLKTSYDNSFVTRQIPGNELGYSWIRNSISGTLNDQTNLLNYQNKSGYTTSGSTSVEQITFASSSDAGAAISGSFASSFSGITISVKDPINSSSFTDLGNSLESTIDAYKNEFLISTLTQTQSAKILNNILNSRGLVYGYSTVNQLRVGKSKAVTNIRNNNFFTFTVERPIVDQSSLSVSSKQGLVKDITYVFKAPSVMFGLKPIDFSIISTQNGIKNRFYARAEHSNDSFYFDDPEMNNRLNLAKLKFTASENLINLLKLDKTLELEQLNYRETIFPAKNNLFSKYTRTRIGFNNNFWRDSISNRILKGLQSKNESVTRDGFGYERSSWDLDATPQFFTYNHTNVPSPSAHPTVYARYQPAGILQNFTTFNRYLEYAPSSLKENTPATDLKVEPIFHRPHFEYNLRSVVSPFGMGITLSDNTTKIRDVSINTYYTGSFIGSGYAKWQAGEQAEVALISQSLDGQTEEVFASSPTNPFDDNYDVFSEDIRNVAKDMSIIPEFRISDHTEKLLTTDRVDVFSLDKTFSIPGKTKVNNEPIDSSEEFFYETYTNSDFLKYFSVVRNDVKDFVSDNTLTLQCKAAKKFIPYDGFYPAERTVEIAKRFFKDFGESIIAEGEVGAISDTNKLRPTLQTLFAPGILFNTIKSGLAVDYPIYTASYSTGSRHVASGSSVSYKGITSKIHTRLPFEAIYKPANYLNGLRVYDNEASDHSKIRLDTPPVSGYTGSLNNYLNVSSNTTLYTYMINNFLAETANLFLQDGEPTKINSAPEDSFKMVYPGQAYGMRIKMFRSLDRPMPMSGNWGNYPLPQIVDMGNQLPSYYILLNEALIQGFMCNSDTSDTIISPDTSLINLTCSITLSGALGSYTLTGTGSAFGPTDDPSFSVSAHYTSTTFDFDIDNSAINRLDNGSNTMRILAKAINNSSAGNEFVASYLGSIYMLDQDMFGNPANGLKSNSPALSCQANNVILSKDGDRNPISYYHCIKIDTKNYITATINISNSLSPANITTGAGTLDQFFIAKQNIEDYVILPSDYNNNNVTLSFPVLDSALNASPRETLTMYSRPSAFGPPILGVTGSSSPDTSFSSSYDLGNGFNLPFTPPYYDGEAWMDVIYVPQGTVASDNDSASGSNSFIPKLSDASSNSIFVFPQTSTKAGVIPTRDGTYYNLLRFDSAYNKNPGTTLPLQDGNANSSSMQLDSSILPFEITTGVDGKRHWTIKTKFETPILNFAHLTSSDSVDSPTGPVSASIPRGIWHQFGRIPGENEGVYLQVTDLPANWLQNSDKSVVDGTFITSGYTVKGKKPVSLVDICGFPTEPIKIGKIAPQKVIKEAVIAIPFTEKSGERQFFSLDRFQVEEIIDGIKYIENYIGSEYTNINDFKNAVTNYGSELPNSNDLKKIFDGNSISDMVLKMKNYNLPPMFDFINYPDVSPISMYIFEFAHVLGVNDLSHIWQNLPPPSLKSTQLSTSTITHPFLSDELIGDWTKGLETSNTYTAMPDNVKWMVFKVKQKAKKDYDLILKGVSTLPENNINLSYNWPYDNFSMIELVKLDATVNLSNKRSYSLDDQSDRGDIPKISNVTRDLIDYPVPEIPRIANEIAVPAPLPLPNDPNRPTPSSPGLRSPPGFVLPGDEATIYRNSNKTLNNLMKNKEATDISSPSSNTGNVNTTSPNRPNFNTGPGPGNIQ